MTGRETGDAGGPDRLRLLATFVAGRPMGVAAAPAGQLAHTDGRLVLVSAGASAAEHRREVLVQSALLGAGSLDPAWVKGIRGRPATARRYLALEGCRVLAEVATRVPAAAGLPVAPPVTTSAAESLRLAAARGQVPEPPPWFGAIRPSRLLAARIVPASAPTGDDLRRELDRDDDADAEDDGPPAERSVLLRIFENPMASRAVSDFFRKLFGGGARGAEDGPAGAELHARALRRAARAGPHARPAPSRIALPAGGRPGAGGVLHPEWDGYEDRYRADWCRVLTIPLTGPAAVAAADVPDDEVLRRGLSRVGLGPKVLRRRADGEDIDTDALVDLLVDVRGGHLPPERIYLERRRLARDLGVLILLDASGSAVETHQAGLAVHEHQRRAAATLASTLEELGDRVAVYAFRSQGRHAVHLLAVKTFGHRFGVVGRSRLDLLQPSGYTRLGAAIRGAGEILQEEAGTPNRLLLVLSDGVPYDEGYEGRYAAADTRRALEELRSDGVACLCLSVGSVTPPGALEGVFGPADHAAAPTLADLSPRLGELFESSLRRLAAPRP
jgi:nitric oxide reductase NorD protein